MYVFVVVIEMINKNNIKITKKGYDNLVNELNYLIHYKRPQVTQALKEAGELGDLRENSEYDAARDNESKNEMRIHEIEHILKHAQIIEKANQNIVEIGSKVKIKCLNNLEFEEYEIAGLLEADPFSNKVTYVSPIGEALYGHKVDDTVSIVTPSASYDVKIVEISTCTIS